jgi:hypothetical protein
MKKNNIIKIIALILTNLFFGLLVYKLDYNLIKATGGCALIFIGLVFYVLINYIILYDEAEQDEKEK